MARGMVEGSNELVHQAELLLQVFGNKGAQRELLLAIEKELKLRGETPPGLSHRIDSACFDEAIDPGDYRCHYQMQTDFDQQDLMERVFELNH